LPSIVGGDVVRAALAARATGRPEATVFGSVADRVVDLAASACLIVLGGVLARHAYPRWASDALAVALLVGALGTAALAPLVLRRPLRRWPRRLRRPIGRSLVVLRRLGRAPRAALLAGLASIAVQAAFVLLNAWLGRALGVTVPLGVWFFAWPLAKVTGLLPVSVGGLAVRGATLAALLAPAGVPLALGVVSAVIWHSVTVAGGLVSGVVWWALSARRVGLRDLVRAGRRAPAAPEHA
jgi:uncharacterized membrane protein YbhN (UPF0104 family)